MTDISFGVDDDDTDDDNDNDDFPWEEFLPAFPPLVPLLLFDLFFLAMVDFEVQWGNETYLDQRIIDCKVPAQYR